MAKKKLIELLSNFNELVNNFNEGFSVSYFDNDIWGTENLFISEFRIRALDIALITQKLNEFSNEEIAEALEEI
jgi:hypothetical protein